MAAELVSVGGRDLENTPIWQQAAGDNDRNYVDICLRWGVILNGPSAIGPWETDAARLYMANEVSPRKCADLERFGVKMQHDDIVVLRLGTKDIHAVGRIVGKYQYHEAFLDIDGWDIAHVRRVRWLWRASGTPKSFETFALKQGDTTQLLGNGDKTKPIRDWTISIVRENKDAPQLLPELPTSKINSITLVDACRALYDSGLSSSSVTSVHNSMTDLAKLAGWYKSYASGVSESETVAQLVLPLMGVLGWSPQTLAMEWSPKVGGRIDLAAFRPFRRGVRSDDDIVLIVEAKRLNSSCLKGVEQALTYCQSLPNCLRLVVSDGMRYAIFVRRSGADSFDRTPAAYLNLLAPKDHYPILQCYGADEALLFLSAAWHPNLAKPKNTHEGISSWSDD